MKSFLIIILLLAGLAAGCRKNVTPAAPEPPTAAEAEYIPAPSAITPPEPRAAAKPAEAPRPEAVAPTEIFLEAERNFYAGNFRRAAQIFPFGTA